MSATSWLALALVLAAALWSAWSLLILALVIAGARAAVMHLWSAAVEPDDDEPPYGDSGL